MTSSTDTLARPGELAASLEEHLLGHVMPFWTRFALDPRGGLNTCIRDDGTVVSRDKWLWSQWRAVWVFSELYNRIERRPEWLEAARHIFAFVTRHGWDEREGGWVLVLDGDGRVLRGHESVYTDGFAISGAAAFSRASGDPEPLTVARRTA